MPANFEMAQRTGQRGVVLLLLGMCCLVAWPACFVSGQRFRDAYSKLKASGPRRADNQARYLDPLTFGDYGGYRRRQKQLRHNQAPMPYTDWAKLIKPDSRYAFADHTPHILETCDSDLCSGKSMLIRPRRFGKTVFGQMWLDFVRGNQDLFCNLSINCSKVPESCVGVRLDFSGAQPSSCGRLLTRRLNEGLTIAGLPKIDPATPSDSLDLPFLAFLDLLQAADRKAAVFVDEYDILVRESSAVTYEAAMDVTKQLFMLLKNEQGSIPFVLVTGSSRIALSGLWSGGNDIEDISYEESMALALGYSWEQISDLFHVQLCMLQELHGLSPVELKHKIQLMYNGYRFSPDSDQMVFNTFAINRLMQTGMFDAHFAESGLSGSLSTGFLPAAEVVSLGIEGNSVDVTFQNIKAWRYNPSEASEPLSVWVQLLTAGILTFDTQGQQLCLKVPNDDARFALSKVLSAFAAGVDLQSFSRMLIAGDINGAIKLLQPRLREIAKDLAANAAGAQGILEYHLQQAFFALAHMLWMQDRTDVWKITSEVRAQQHGPKRRLDFLITLKSSSGDVFHALEFGCHRGSGEASLKSAVIGKLEQAQRYFEVSGNPGATRVSVVMWSGEGLLLCVAGPYSQAESMNMVDTLQGAPFEGWLHLL